MSKKKNKKFIEEQEIVEEAVEELDEVENGDWTVNEEKLEEAKTWENSKENNSKEDEACFDKLVKLQADFENFKARVEREKSDMIFFLKQDILLKVLPRLDDLERIISNTPENEKSTSVYEGIVAMEKKLKADLEKMWVKSFCSKWKEVDPDKHEVMTTVPWQKENIICDEFEKGYTLDGRILRHAKVVVGAWE